MLEKLIEGIESFLPSISIIPVLGTCIYYIFKIMNRNKIDRIIESKYRNKMYDLFEILFISIIISIGIAVYSFSINVEWTSVLFFIFVVVSLFIFIIGSILIGISYVLQQVKTSNILKKYLLKLVNKFSLLSKLYLKFSQGVTRKKVLKVSLLAYFFSLMIINFYFLQMYKASDTLLESILTMMVFSLLYLFTFYVFRYLFSRESFYKRDLIEVTVIEDVNDCLRDLRYLYAINDKKFVFSEKEAAINNDINSLIKFYIYYVEENHLLLFQVYNKQRD